MGTGFHAESFRANYLDVTRTHVGLISGIGNCLSSVSAMLAPFVVGTIVKQYSGSSSSSSSSSEFVVNSGSRFFFFFGTSIFFFVYGSMWSDIRNPHRRCCPSSTFLLTAAAAATSAVVAAPCGFGRPDKGIHLTSTKKADTIDLW